MKLEGTILLKFNEDSLFSNLKVKMSQLVVTKITGKRVNPNGRL